MDNYEIEPLFLQLSRELLTSAMRHPFHIRVYARPDFQVFNLGLGYSEYRKAA